MKTQYTLKEVEAIIIEIKMIQSKGEDSNYNWLNRQLRYYTKLANSLKVGA